MALVEAVAVGGRSVPAAVGGADAGELHDMSPLATRPSKSPPRSRSGTGGEDRRALRKSGGTIISPLPNGQVMSKKNTCRGHMPFTRPTTGVQYFLPAPRHAGESRLSARPDVRGQIDQASLPLARPEASTEKYSSKLRSGQLWANMLPSRFS